MFVYGQLYVKQFCMALWIACTSVLVLAIFWKINILLHSKNQLHFTFMGIRKRACKLCSFVYIKRYLQVTVVGVHK